MLTHEQVRQIDADLQAGVTPEDVAAKHGWTYHQLRSALLNSGKRIVITRRLEDTAPIDTEAAVPLAA